MNGNICTEEDKKAASNALTNTLPNDNTPPNEVTTSNDDSMSNTNNSRPIFHFLHDFITVPRHDHVPPINAGTAAQTITYRKSNPYPTRGKRAWVTLLANKSYIPGVILLAYSLHKQMSKYRLIVLYTSGIDTACLTGLIEEQQDTGYFYLQPIEALRPPMQMVNLISERSRDTWTKLRVFEMYGWKKLVFLDAEMMLFKNMDALFDVELPEGGIAANHCCVCNLDNDSWAPSDWNVENCAWTGSKYPEAIFESPAVPPPGTGKPTHQLLNSGLFVFEPSEKLWIDILIFFDTSPLLPTFLFPDQDFLAHFFSGKWKSIPWHYNALKTWKYWHPEMWRDNEVTNLHYIVDKPWAAMPERDENTGKITAGYLGKDGETHEWWWKEYNEWMDLRMMSRSMFVLTLMEELLPNPDTERLANELVDAILNSPMERSLPRAETDQLVGGLVDVLSDLESSPEESNDRSDSSE